MLIVLLRACGVLFINARGGKNLQKLQMSAPRISRSHHHHPNIISRRFRLNYTCGVLRPFNLFCCPDI